MYPSASPPTPPPPQKKKGRTTLRALVIVAALVFGIPGALLVAGIVAVAIRGAPEPSDLPAAAPLSVEASAAPQAVAPPPPPEPDPLDPFDLAPGDCYNSLPLPNDGSTVLIDTVEPVPCSEPHTAQVFARFAYADAVWSEATDAKSINDCGQSFRRVLTKKVRNDDRYQLGRIHSDRAEPGLQTVHAACIVATNARTTGSALTT